MLQVYNVFHMFQCDKTRLICGHIDRLLTVIYRHSCRTITHITQSNWRFSRRSLMTVACKVRTGKKQQKSKRNWLTLQKFYLYTWNDECVTRVHVISMTQDYLAVPCSWIAVVTSNSSHIALTYCNQTYGYKGRVHPKNNQYYGILPLVYISGSWQCLDNGKFLRLYMYPFPQGYTQE